MMDLSESAALSKRAMGEGWHHWQRVAASRGLIQIEEVRHSILFTDPYNMDAPVNIVILDPRCVSELMAGHIHPPAEAINAQVLHFNCQHCGPIICRRLDAPEIRALHKIRSEVVIDSRRMHLEIAAPMTYDQAIEWILQVEVPFAVWGKKHNSPQYKIVPICKIPTDRTHRNSWKLPEIG